MQPPPQPRRIEIDPRYVDNRPPQGRYAPPQWFDVHPSHGHYGPPPPGFSPYVWNRYRNNTLSWFDFRLAICSGFGGYNWLWTNSWYDRYPHAWRPTVVVGLNWWSPPPWRTVCGWFNGWYVGVGYPRPIVYDYGTNVIIRERTVIVNEEPVTTIESLYEQLREQVSRGKRANINDPNHEWLPLGTFAVLEDPREPDYSIILQLAVDKGGVIRGNIVNETEDTTMQIEGSVDEKTQRAAFSVVGEDENVVAECGLWNLTEDSLTMQIHLGNGETEVRTLIRLSQDQTQKQPPVRSSFLKRGT
jgi:hypothetical protein